MAKITYEDKVDVLVSSLPNKNKINAGDMNQIKNSVNELETDIANGRSEAKIYTDTKIDNLVVGGRNIVLNSNTRIVAGYGSPTISHVSNIIVSEWSATDARRVYGKSGTNKIFGTLATGRDTFYALKNKAYVFSIYIKNNHTSNLLYISANGLTGDVTLSPGEAKRVVIKCVGNGTSYLSTTFQTATTGIEYDFTYWHYQIEEGTIVSDWAPAPEDLISEAKTYADTKIDQLEIGGRNYIPLSSLRNTISYDSFSKSTGLLCTFVDGEYAVVERTTIATARGGIYKNIYFTDYFQIGDTVTLSAEIYIDSLGEGTQNGSIFMRSYKASNESSTLKDLCNTLIDSSCAKGKWIRVSSTETITNTDTLFSQMTVQIMCGYGIAKFKVRNLKFEKGNKATDWAPAPEDIGISNAGTATKLQTARTINGVSFDGSANIEINSVIPIDLYNTTIDINNFNFAKGYKQGVWTCKSDGGTTNIANLPKKSAFLLKLETMRFVGTTDYRQSQTIIYGVSGECYIRWGTETGWSDWVLTAIKGVPMLEDSGWITLDLINGFTAYQGATAYQPICRKVGKTVDLVGQMSPPANSTVGTTTQTTFCVLPIGCRPDRIRTGIMQGSSQAQWLLTISTNGNVLASRYADGAVLTTPASTAWMTIDVTFTVD